MNLPAAVAALMREAQALRERADWPAALGCYQRLVAMLPASAEMQHNLGLCLFGLGRHAQALQHAQRALSLDPALWQSRVIEGRAQKALGQAELAWDIFSNLRSVAAARPSALLDMADLALNEFGEPLEATALVRPLLADPAHARDARLTRLMAALYDRDEDAKTLTEEIKAFARDALTLPGFRVTRPRHASRQRRRVGLISPLFCASPVYFLTIAGFRRMALDTDLVFFSRGARADWASAEFRALAMEWHDVGQMGAWRLAEVLCGSDLDVLYDLGGWMDPVGLQALSVKPAPRMYKWVGGQSVTTGLQCFDGWIGDQWQSPKSLQHLYSEPLINLPGGYATYTPPPYMPKPAQRKSEVPAIFANPAKLSRAYIQMLATIPGPKCFIHRQYRYARVRARIEAVLGPANVDYVCPESHQEALEALNGHAVMLDTFPYSGGLTAREALALGTRVEGRAGQLFCERHTAGLSQNSVIPPNKASIS